MTYPIFPYGLPVGSVRWQIPYPLAAPSWEADIVGGTDFGGDAVLQGVDLVATTSAGPENVGFWLYTVTYPAGAVIPFFFGDDLTDASFGYARDTWRGEMLISGRDTIRAKADVGGAGAITGVWATAWGYVLPLGADRS